MKVQIEKVPEGIRLVLATATNKKPIELVLTPAKVEMVINLLNSAKNADSFSFTLET